MIANPIAIDSLKEGKNIQPTAYIRLARNVGSVPRHIWFKQRTRFESLLTKLSSITITWPSDPASPRSRAWDRGYDCMSSTCPMFVSLPMLINFRRSRDLPYKPVFTLLLLWFFDSLPPPVPPVPCSRVVTPTPLRYPTSLWSPQLECLLGTYAVPVASKDHLPIHSRHHIYYSIKVHTLCFSFWYHQLPCPSQGGYIDRKSVV